MLARDTTLLLSILISLSCCALGHRNGISHPRPQLTYAYCDAPQPVSRPDSTSHLEERLQATVTAHEAKFLSFEEWKARNLYRQVGEQAVQTQTAVSESTPAAVLHQDTSSEVEVESKVMTNHTKMLPSLSEQGELKKSSENAQIKEHFNHASFDCAASIMQSNKESKGSTNVLKENKDYYMLNTCAAQNKFVVIELCNDILVTSVQLANFEFFSGIFKDLKISVAAKYPPGEEGWQELGQFKGRAIRDVQTFPIENPIIWTRYIKVEMLTFYGSEFYCPLSLVRVYGKTMMEDYKQEGNLESELSKTMIDGMQINMPLPQEMLDNVEEAAEGLVALSDRLAGDLQQKQYEIFEPASIVVVSTMDPTMTTKYETAVLSTVASTQTSWDTGSVCLPTHTSIALMHPMEMLVHSPTTLKNAANSPSSISKTTLNSRNEGISDFDADVKVVSTKRDATSVTSSTVTMTTERPSENPTGRSSPAPTPATQESIFKQLAKRLSLLESNATLSLRYIESQSSLLAQSFSHLSATQARHLANFLENVNITMLQRISQMEQEYKQLYLDTTKSSIVLKHRQEHDMNLLSRKINSLKEDITFFKRLGMFQLALMLVLFGFLVTSKGIGIDVQSSLHRALASRSQSASPASWKHRQSQSMSLYSFPVDQIVRPIDKAAPPLDLSQKRSNHGLGLRYDEALPEPAGQFVREEDEKARVMLDGKDQQRQMLERQAWNQNLPHEMPTSDVIDQNEPQEDNQSIDMQGWSDPGHLAAAEDYLTPESVEEHIS